MTKTPQVRALDAIMANADPVMVVVTAAKNGRPAGCLVGFHTQSSIDPWQSWTDLDDHPRYRFNQAQSIGPGYPAPW